ncbi:Rapid ALkalinization Factor [Quillaja saponaria]|uniref:Rapid ALkalinization Factor n=1 Tax=Quillaja saponaria TaxID=32244 RepID=A0AAD7PGU6_QUISA|nr:Rapid ALkalinization Factor [Quillaja saponaria]
MGSSNLCAFLVMCAILATHVVLSSSSAVDFIWDHQLSYFPIKSDCRGSIAECLLAEDDSELFGSEFAMDSESNRRILAARRYISYGALRKNSVPCSRRGASYYNCRPGAQSNPYSRGCSAITRCRR